MAREERDEQVVEQVPQKKTLPLKKLIIIGVAVLVVVTAGVFGAIYYKKLFAKKESTEQQAAVVGAIWPMDPFIVNIQDQGTTDRYLKIIIEFDISDKNCIAELNQLKPKLRDNVLDLLSSKSYKDIMDISGKQRLRDELMVRLNSFLTGGKITKVYFTEFVVQ
jgi:flagellar FliL protein